ncbi:receptor-like protein EIX2 [Tanacetum coccineum]
MSTPSCYMSFLLFITFIHLCLSSKNTSNNVLCKDVEREALLEFKNGLIDHPNKLASWVGLEEECCSWVGIVCDNYTGHVHQIHLPGLDGHCRVDDYTTPKEYDATAPQMLGGDISPSLLNLKQLKHLDLSCNDFGGIEIPSFMGTFTNLRYLNLSSSRFGGIIPHQLGNLSKLEVLSLGSFHDDSYGSELTRMLNLQWLSSLRLLNHLDMSGVDLSKATDWFQVIKSLPSLLKLHLSSCLLSNIYSHVRVFNVTSLLVLDLSDNSFDNSFMPPWIFSITSLVSLDLNGCNLHGPIPSSNYSFRNLTSLELLHVQGNDFMNSSSVLEGLSSVGSNLISLDISYCGVSSSRIVSLHNLTSIQSLYMLTNQLSKVIPRSLGNFCNLRNIDIAGNNFHNISLTFLLQSFFECKSPRLETLSVGYSEVSGRLPDSIGRLTFLKSLSLKENLISGSIPYSIGNLSSLEMLDVRTNQLNGSLPDSLGQLSKLNYLDLSYNRLSGVVTEAHFEKLALLKVFWAISNNLTLRPHVQNWKPSFSLRELNLKFCDLGPLFPSWLAFQSDLEYLDISNTRISSTIPESFWRSIPNLAVLNMSQNNIQGNMFGIPPTLSVIDLSFNNFSGQLPKLSKSSSISVLDLSNNFFVGSLHPLLCFYGGEILDFLNLANNQLSGVIPDCWLKWPILGVLNLENNNLSGVIPTSLGSLSLLGSLNLCNNKLSGTLPASLRNLANLEILQLARNQLVGKIPKWFGSGLSSLRILNLRSNKFDRDIPHELCNLTTIKILVLANNNLSGKIPSCFNKFGFLSGKEDVTNGRILTLSILGTDLLGSASLVTKGREDQYRTILRLVMILDLSSNRLSGQIPVEVTAFNALQTLNLSRNQLTGEIPKKIGDMKAIESFDVSLNNLSGELPISLSRLNFLSSFNVSYNNLTGPIPLSTQLQGFTKSSFFGNKLCGEPVSKSCQVDSSDRDRQRGDDNGSSRTDWGLVISITIGFVAGFWIIVAPLIISAIWRVTYFRFLSDAISKFYDVICK